MSCKVGNQTNSQDPQAINSRVFVGNLNTFQSTKVEVERLFSCYGRIAGISMHKGYAFIQFTNPFDARSACLGEDGRLFFNQPLDVNMVAEPKAHQTGRKRQNIAKTGNDWDYFYSDYYAQVGLPPSCTPRLVPPPIKRARMVHVPQNSNVGVGGGSNTGVVLNNSRNQQNHNRPNHNKPQHPKENTQSSISELKTYSTPDILICGNCRELFTDIEQLIDHKKDYCKLRFTCKCKCGPDPKLKNPGEAALLCSQCKETFHSAWDLMVHLQAAHMLTIYQLAKSTAGGTSRDESVGSSSSSCSVSNSNSIDNNNSFTATTNGKIDPIIDEDLEVIGMGSNHLPNSNESGSGASPAGGELGSGEICMDSVGVGGQMNGSSVISVATFPMEASTQTMSQDNGQNNFECGLLSSGSSGGLLHPLGNDVVQGSKNFSHETKLFC